MIDWNVPAKGPSAAAKAIGDAYAAAVPDPPTCSVCGGVIFDKTARGAHARCAK